MLQITLKLFGFVVMALGCAAATGEDAAVEHLIDRICAQERLFIASLATESALLETYIQEIPAPGKSDEQALRDHYFLLGRFDLSRA